MAVRRSLYYRVPETSVDATPAVEIEQLYREDGARLWRAVLAFSGDPDVASDAVSEAFAQCLRRGREIRSPSAWVWRTAFRIAAGELKEARRRGEAMIEATYEMPDGTSELVSALRRLSPRQRAALVLRYYAGYTPAEIAEITGSAAPTVRVHLMRGRRGLRRLLQEEGHEA